MPKHSAALGLNGASTATDHAFLHNDIWRVVLCTIHCYRECRENLSQLAAGSVSPSQAELQAADDLARHQEALNVVSAFAAQLHGHMQTCTSEQAVTHGSEVLQACCKVAGADVTSTLWSETTLLVSPCLSHCLLLLH